MAKIVTEEGVKYVRNIHAPIYKPRGDKPELDKLLDLEKYFELVDKVVDSNVSEAEKEFLLLTATRHVVFSYKDIAEYYCHASPEMQDLMEEMALVILDFEDAIEKGYVRLSKNVMERWTKEHGSGKEN